MSLKARRERLRKKATEATVAEAFETGPKSKPKSTAAVQSSSRGMKFPARQEEEEDLIGVEEELSIETAPGSHLFAMADFKSVFGGSPKTSESSSIVVPSSWQGGHAAGVSSYSVATHQVPSDDRNFGMSTHREAFVTLSTNDRYAYGALVLGQSLRNSGTSRDLVVLITPSVSAVTRGLLARVFTRIVQVDPLDSHDATHLALMARPELGTTFTKLHCWNLLEYSKCVFLDADTLVLQNVDELFDRPELSAAPDIGWPDCFNSGVFVFVPNSETFSKLLDLAVSKGSFDGADQGLLNQFFSSWATSDPSHRLSFVYNMAATITYSYLPAFLHYGQGVKIVHFLGSPVKPWDHSYNPITDEVTLHGTVDPVQAAYTMPYLKVWWRIYKEHIEPMVHDLMGSGASSGMLSVPSVASVSRHEASGHAVSNDPSPPDAWDYGQVDYTGRDRFENIQKHLDSMMNRNNDK